MSFLIDIVRCIGFVADHPSITGDELLTALRFPLAIESFEIDGSNYTAGWQMPDAHSLITVEFRFRNNDIQDIDRFLRGNRLSISGFLAVDARFIGRPFGIGDSFVIATEATPCSL